jgi:hypothetical protein
VKLLWIQLLKGGSLDYLTRQVGKQASMFRIHRFCPSSKKVFETVEILAKEAATQ